MAAFEKVAVIGKGNLGSFIVEQLVKAGFAVTILTRNLGSLKGVPDGVKTVEVDYTSTESMMAALRGQDVAVSTVGFEGIAGQRSIIDACIKAGVKRFIPSDFGSFTTDPNAQAAISFLKMLGDIQKYLAEKAQAGLIEYTIFASGAFRDLVFTTPLFADFKNRTIKLYDGGKHPFNATSLANIGKAVAAALQNSEATKNRKVCIRDFEVTQAKILALAKKYCPGEWTETHLDGEVEYQAALTHAKEDNSVPNAYHLLAVSLLGGKFPAAYEPVDNELLALEPLSDEEFEASAAAGILKA